MKEKNTENRKRKSFTLLLCGMLVAILLLPIYGRLKK